MIYNFIKKLQAYNELNRDEVTRAMNISPSGLSSRKKNPFTFRLYELLGFADACNMSFQEREEMFKEVLEEWRDSKTS